MSGHRHIGVDLDGTLAYYDDNPHVIGAPVESVLRRVRAALERRWKVTVITGRLAGYYIHPVGSLGYERALAQNRLVCAWLVQHIGRQLDVTAVKLPTFSEIWDDRAVRVLKNLGQVSYEAPCWDALNVEETLLELPRPQVSEDMLHRALVAYAGGEDYNRTLRGDMRRALEAVMRKR